jgi:hypothetical protein
MLQQGKKGKYKVSRGGKDAELAHSLSDWRGRSRECAAVVWGGGDKQVHQATGKRAVASKQGRVEARWCFQASFLCTARNAVHT